MIDVAHDGENRVGGERLQLSDDAGKVIRAVFAIDQQPVETAGGDEFGAIGVGQTEKQPDPGFPCRQCPFETIERHLHARFLRQNGS